MLYLPINIYVSAALLDYAPKIHDVAHFRFFSKGEALFVDVLCHQILNFSSLRGSADTFLGPSAQ
jgi:hypothetical protein